MGVRGRKALATISALHGLYLLATGLGVGVLSGLFGVGGGVIAIPALVWTLHLDQHMAQGTSLVMMVPTSLWGVYRYARRGHVVWRSAAIIGAASVALATVAARVAFALPSTVLQVCFACFLIYLAIANLRRALRPGVIPPARQTPRGGILALLGIGGAVGTMGGLLGLGGGSIAVPSLVLWSALSQQSAQGTSLAVIVVSAVTGATNYALAGAVDPWAALALAIGAFATVPAGAALAHRLPPKTLTLAFATLLIVVSTASVLRAI